MINQLCVKLNFMQYKINVRLQYVSKKLYIFIYYIPTRRYLRRLNRIYLIIVITVNRY